jgi:hypothetical protein
LVELVHSATADRVAHGIARYADEPVRERVGPQRSRSADTDSRTIDRDAMATISSVDN